MLEITETELLWPEWFTDIIYQLYLLIMLQYSLFFATLAICQPALMF